MKLSRRLEKAQYSGVFPVGVIIGWVLVTTRECSGDHRIQPRFVLPISTRRIGLTASIQGRWRSRYGYRDLDGNNLANRSDEFVPAYAVFGAAVTKTVSVVRAFEAVVQLGLDNALDHTYPTLVPSLSGRRVYVSLQFNF